MSNFEEQGGQNATDQNQKQNQNREPDMDDPGFPKGAQEPLSAEERDRLEKETQHLVEGEPVYSDVEGNEASDYGAGSEAGGMEDDVQNRGRGDYAGAERDGGIGGTAAAGGVAGFDAGPDGNNYGDNVGTNNETDANTGYGISEVGTGGGIDGVGDSGLGQRPTGASPTSGGASAGANTAGIGQGTTDFDEEDSENRQE